MFSYTEVVWDRYTDVRRILRVGLTPINGIVNRPDLAHCLRTRFDSDEDVVSPLLLRQLYPSIYTTIEQK